MPPLLELQREIARSLVKRDVGTAAGYIIADGLPPEARLSIYRNTFIGTLTTALRLTYPAVHRLVGAEFFESTAALFIEAHPPGSAYLNEYGEAFAKFLASFPSAASLTYLPGVARLEWAVNRALHAPDFVCLDINRLAVLDPAAQDRVCFMPHPAIGLVHDGAPVDLVWCAVLEQDDRAMAAVDLGAGPVWLLVERGPTGVEVKRLDPHAWHFAQVLFAEGSIGAALAAAPSADAPRLIADHLAAGHFIDFESPEPPDPADSSEPHP